MSLEVYPELYAIVGSSTPNMLDKVAWGSTTPGQIKIAGLPNITGTLKIEHASIYAAQEAISVQSWRASIGAGNTNSYYGNTITFNASRCSSVYGNSNTVQPPAYTVKYLIRALP